MYPYLDKNRTYALPFKYDISPSFLATGKSEVARGLCKEDHLVWSPIHRRAIKKDSKVINRGWVNH